MYVWTEAVSDMNFPGHPKRRFEKRPKNNNKAWIKLSEAILSILGGCWKKVICTTLPASLMEEFPVSKVHLQPATWLTGKFPRRHHGPVGSGHRAKLSTSVEGGVFRQIAHSSYLPAILSFKGHIIFPNLPAKTEKNFLKNRYFEEQIHWAPLTFVPTQKLSGTVWTISLRFVCLFQMPMNAQRQPSVTSSMATVPIRLVPTFVPAKLVSLVMEGTVLVRRIQICFCKNNHIPAINLTWIEK